MRALSCFLPFLVFSDASQKLKSIEMSKVPVEHILFLHLQKSWLWPQWGDESRQRASAAVSILFILWLRSKERGFLGYVQVQEIDSVILKIQWQSFITFLSLFPFSFVEWKKISQFIKLLLWKVSWGAILTPVLLCKTMSDSEARLPLKSLSGGRRM